MSTKLQVYSEFADRTARQITGSYRSWTAFLATAARLIQNVLTLSEEEVRQITRFRRGEGLLCIGYNHVPIAFYATQKEYDAITTSPTDLLNRNIKNETV